MSFPQGFLPLLKCSAHSDYTPPCFTSTFGSVSLRQQLQPTLYSPGRCCPISKTTYPSTFSYDKPFVAHSETSASQRHSKKLPTSAAWLHVGFSPYLPWRPNHSALPVAQELMWMHPEQIELIQVPL